MDQAWHEHEPRVVARGIWEADENGDVTYWPPGQRPPGLDDGDDDGADPVEGSVCEDRLARPVAPAPAPAAQGYRRRSDAVWEQARADYLAGHTAEAVCARYDLAPGTLRHRARREGWRRSDQPDPAPAAWDDDAEDLAAADLPDYAAMARAALVRADRAIRAGRDLEAARWLRMHERLSRLITDYNWRLTAWRETEAAAPPAAPISDDSDNSDCVFAEPAPAACPSPLAGEGGGRRPTDEGWTERRDPSSDLAALGHLLPQGEKDAASP